MTPKSNIKIELSEDKKQIILRGSLEAFHELYDQLSNCWNTDVEMTRGENVSYIGVIAYVCYDIRHAYMGNRLVKLDGKPVEQWDDNMIELFENEAERFEVGVEFPVPNFMFILASLWESYRHLDAPAELLSELRIWTKALERLLKSINRTHYAMIDPYLHGAIYAANPYLMHSLEQIEYNWCRYTTAPLKHLAHAFKITAYGTKEYQEFYDRLERDAAKLGCSVAEMRLGE